MKNDKYTIKTTVTSYSTYDLMSKSEKKVFNWCIGIILSLLTIIMILGVCGVIK